MSNQSQQTAEKSVQTHDLSGATTRLVTNSSENTATEVANTLVSMATGHQRGAATVKQISLITVPTPAITTTTAAAAAAAVTLPILSLADYTTSQGVPTATSLANQAKLTPRKQDHILTSNSDDTSMSTDDYNQIQNDTNITIRSRRGKSSKRTSTSKVGDEKNDESIQYGPIVVKPRKHVAPTLSSGRKSKDEQLPPEEDIKRQQRRDRNKQAAAKCRRKRNELREQLEKDEQALTSEHEILQNSIQNLSDRKHRLEVLLSRHACLRKLHLPMTNTTTNPSFLSKADAKIIPTTTLLDSNANKRVTISFTNAQDIFSAAPLARTTTSLPDPSSSTPPSSAGVSMITIHITPEVAQALLGSTSVDKVKLAELLHQASTTSSVALTTNAHVATDLMATSASTNSTS